VREGTVLGEESRMCMREEKMWEHIWERSLRERDKQAKG